MGSHAHSREVPVSLSPSGLRGSSGVVQAAAVCYRVSGPEVEFLLVRTRAGRLDFPQGRHRARPKPGAIGRSGSLRGSRRSRTHRNHFLRPLCAQGANQNPGRSPGQSPEPSPSPSLPSFAKCAGWVNRRSQSAAVRGFPPRKRNAVCAKAAPKHAQPNSPPSSIARLPACAGLHVGAGNTVGKRSERCSPGSLF